MFSFCELPCKLLLVALRFQVTRYDILEVAFAPERRCWPTRRGRSVSRGGLPTPLPIHSCSSPDSDSSPPSSDGSSPSRAAVASSAPPSAVGEQPRRTVRAASAAAPIYRGPRTDDLQWASEEEERARRGKEGVRALAFSRVGFVQDPLEVTLGPLQGPNTKLQILFILHILYNNSTGSICERI